MSPPTQRHAERCACITTAASFYSGLLCLGLVVFFHPSLLRADEPIDYVAVIEKITRSLPNDWHVVETKMDVLPEGHYWGLKYEGRKGWELVLQGSRDVHFHWKDRKDVWHQEPLAKEALRLWLMPPDYKDRLWRQYFVMKSPVTAKLLFSGPTVKMYSHPSIRVVDVERVDEVVRGAKSFGFPGSPKDTGILSWRTWKKDIKESLRGD